MSGIRNPNKTFGYAGESDDWQPVEPCPEHPDGLPGSKWFFRTEQTSDDRDICNELVSRTIMGKVDKAHVKRLMKEGGDVEAYLATLTSTDTFMSAEKAMLAVMTNRVEGPFFTVPTDYTDEDGEPHPLAGRLIPQPPPRKLLRENRDLYKAQVTTFSGWIGLIEPAERAEVLSFMTSVWVGRDPTADARFQARRERLDESTPGDPGGPDSGTVSGGAGLLPPPPDGSD